MKTIAKLIRNLKYLARIFLRRDEQADFDALTFLCHRFVSNKIE